MNISEAKKRAFYDLLLEKKQRKFPICAAKLVEGTHLVMMDSHIGGCISWCTAVVDGRSEQIPEEHQRYLHDTLLFLERIAPTETEPACIEQFSLWIRLVRSMLALIDADDSTEATTMSRDELT